MLELKKKTAKLLADAVSEKFGENLLSAENISKMLEYPPDKSMGDLALPCFRPSKTLGKSPVQIAEVLAESVKCEEFSSVSAVSGYLNFKIDAKSFSRRVVADIASQGDKYGSPM